jgi:hypothetical protein
LESTGLGNDDLIWGSKYYIERYFGSNSSNVLVGATVGNSIPAPNSELEDFDLWFVEAYNLFGARFNQVEDQCERFIVDSLPKTRDGLCGRDCKFLFSFSHHQKRHIINLTGKDLTCNVVVPTCDTSLYEQHQNDPAQLKESFRDLILPNKTTASLLRCTTNWRYALTKRFEISYDNARYSLKLNVSESVSVAMRSVRDVLDKTFVLFSNENAAYEECLYPEDGSCGVPRAFGSNWTRNQFISFARDEFPTLGLDVIVVEDDEKDKMIYLNTSFSSSRRKREYYGIFQFSFFPNAWF